MQTILMPDITVTLHRSDETAVVSTDIETGWPGLHLYSFRKSEGWSPDAARTWFERWSAMSLPCASCKSDWSRWIEKNPPDYRTPKSFFRWSVRAHNAVSKRINVDGSHPPMPLARALALWSSIASAGPVAWYSPVNEQPITPSSKRLVITIATGPCRPILDVSRQVMREYADRCGADFIELTNTTQSWWGLEKFRIAHFARQYEETLFLDCDVLPVGRDLFEYARENLGSPDVAMHDDYPYLHRLGTEEWIHPERALTLRCTGNDAMYRNICLNSGVVYTRRAAADLWAAPKTPIPTTHCAEQFIVEWNLHALQSRSDLEIRFAQLPTEFNMQWWMNYELSILYSDFIHSANAPNRSQELERVLQIRSRIDQCCAAQRLK